MEAGQSVAKHPEVQDEQLWHDEIFNVEVCGTYVGGLLL
jgi:hypothetical protein